MEALDSVAAWVLRAGTANTKATKTPISQRRWVLKGERVVRDRFDFGTVFFEFFEFCLAHA
jgi:hypothetical protein